MMEILTSSIFGNNVCGIIPSPVVGEIEYQMWDSYIAQNMTQGLFFMETHSNIISNIQGGNGYWCGMGASEYAIKLDKEKLYPSPNNLIINHLHLLQAENQSVFSPHLLS